MGGAINKFKAIDYPIDDGKYGFHGRVHVQSTNNWSVRTKQIELYLYLIRNIKYILPKCADNAYKLIKRNRNNPFIDSHLIESMDEIVDETAIDDITITSKKNILISLRIFAGYWTPEYRIKVDDNLESYSIKKV